MCLNLVYVESAVLHAGLSDPERVELVARFNDPEDSLMVLIITHSVSSQDVNLDIKRWVLTHHLDDMKLTSQKEEIRSPR